VVLSASVKNSHSGSRKNVEGLATFLQCTRLEATHMFVATHVCVRLQSMLATGFLFSNATKAAITSTTQRKTRTPAAIHYE